jgi:hypothetical protein
LTQSEHWELIWKTWSPPKCKFFLWLADLRRCWIADRLNERGLSHPDKCPLRDKEQGKYRPYIVGVCLC